MKGGPDTGVSRELAYKKSKSSYTNKGICHVASRQLEPQAAARASQEGDLG